MLAMNWEYKNYFPGFPELCSEDMPCGLHSKMSTLKQLLENKLTLTKLLKTLAK